VREASTPGDPSGTPPEPARTDEQKAASVERILRGELTAEQVCLEEGVPPSELEQWARIYRRAARRAVDDQLTAVLSARGLEVDEAPATEFSGSLDALALAELIQTLRYGRKDAQIRIEHEGEQSHVWCVAGDVVDAESGQLSGNAAMYRLLALQQGRVHADFLPVRRARTIHTSTQALLLEAAQRSDECQELRRRLGDTGALYVPSGSAPTHAPTEPGHAQVLAAFDGRRTLDEIVRASELPDLETLAIIAGLVERRWLEPKLPPRPSSPAAERRGSVAVQRSFSPTVASVGLRSPRKSAGVSRLWLSAASGVALVCGAFAIGFWSARKDVSLRAAAAKSRAPQVCPAGMSALSHGVCLSDTEVTAGQYQACVAAGVCQADWSPAGAPPAATSPASSPGDDFAAQCNGGQPGREQYPINCVNFRQAQRYCEWRGERLPSDAEWTLAASRVGEVSEWTSGSAPARAGDPGDGADARQVVLGAGFATGLRAPTLSGLFMNANAQGRRVGFRCARELPSVTPGSASAS
jgi:transposase-like protein